MGVLRSIWDKDFKISLGWVVGIGVIIGIVIVLGILLYISLVD